MKDYDEHHVPSSETIVFAFASGDTSRFEWRATLEHCGVSFCLVRDSTNRWYAEGVAGLGGFSDTHHAISRIAEPYERTLALGLSKGGYGALLYGAMARLDAVVAISAVTGKGEDVWPDIPIEHRQKVHHYPGDPLFPDLKPIYSTRPQTRAFCFISDGPGCEIDFHMARRIQPQLISILPGHSHDQLGKAMRDTGRIKEIICGG